MSAAGSLDANVILRLILGDIPEQQQAAAALIGRVAGQFAVADTALMEAIFVLGRAYSFSRSDTAAAIRDVMSDVRVNCNRALFDEALTLYVAYPALSFEDCALATYATLGDAEPLYTFDKKLAHAAKSAQLITT